MHQIRTIKTVLVASMALFASLVAFNNITDYQSNFAFVQHVLMMDTTFEGNRLMYRAIESQLLHHLFYLLIILAEAMVGLLCGYGAWKLWQAKDAPEGQFKVAKKFANLGLTLGVLLWFVGFMTIGAEWFAMWQSQSWNGQDAAFKFIVILFLTLLFLNQSEEP
ncbi:DUF2165 family protein [Gayadomonas joobiniege]|uniref:DUF2165 family protein n=1 Tax=Gayadomonas joobiniege TaxID=1234606 RepID=UPI0003680D6D|nr:DUF2165 domain-containing protein [Gayadomonas joobiniege]